MSYHTTDHLYRHASYDGDNSHDDFNIIVVTGAISVGKSTLIRQAADQIDRAYLYRDPSEVDIDAIQDGDFIFFKEQVPDFELQCFNIDQNPQTFKALQFAIFDQFDRLHDFLVKIQHLPVTVVLERHPLDSLKIFIPLNDHLVSQEDFDRLCNMYEKLISAFNNWSTHWVEIVVDLHIMLHYALGRNEEAPVDYLEEVWEMYNSERLPISRHISNDESDDLELPPHVQLIDFIFDKE